MDFTRPSQDLVWIHNLPDVNIHQIDIYIYIIIIHIRIHSHDLTYWIWYNMISLDESKITFLTNMRILGVAIFRAATTLPPWQVSRKWMNMACLKKETTIIWMNYTTIHTSLGLVFFRYILGGPLIPNINFRCLPWMSRDSNYSMESSTCYGKIWKSLPKAPMKISETAATARKSHMRPSLEARHSQNWGIDIYSLGVAPSQ